MELTFLQNTTLDLDMLIGLTGGLFFALFIGFYLMNIAIGDAFGHHDNLVWVLLNTVIGVALTIGMVLYFQSYLVALTVAVTWFFVSRSIRIIGEHWYDRWLRWREPIRLRKPE